MKNFIIIFALIVILGIIVRYIFKSKKNGKKCIGCPYSETCGKKSEDFDCCRD